MSIALDLRVTRKTVRLARERLGIPSLPPGRRRLPVAAALPARKSAADLIDARVIEERRRGTPPTLTTIAERVRELAGAASRREGLIALEAVVRLALDHELAREAA